MNPIKWIKNKLCKHEGMLFCASTGVEPDESFQNITIGVTAHCPKCKMAWCGDLKAGATKLVMPTPPTVEALLSIPKAVDRIDQIIQTLAGLDPAAKEFFGDEVNSTNFKRNFEASKDFQRMIELYMSTDEKQRELIDMIKCKPAKPNK